MSLFAPQNVMGPAHRGGVIQQLAQGAAQNVMRRQKLKALLQHSAGAAAGHAIGAGQPFRSSLQGHATGVRGSTYRPPGMVPGGGAGLFGGAGLQAPDPQSIPAWADPGGPDLPSLPDPHDPSQSPSATQPGAALTPPGGWLEAAPVSGAGGGVGGAGPSSGGYVQPSPYGAGSGGFSTGGVALNNGGGTGRIPLGGGVFYDPATDTIHRPGAQLGG